jgi:hypothetical protein
VATVVGVDGLSIALQVDVATGQRSISASVASSAWITPVSWLVFFSNEVLYREYGWLGQTRWRAYRVQQQVPFDRSRRHTLK